MTSLDNRLEQFSRYAGAVENLRGAIRVLEDAVKDMTDLLPGDPWEIHEPLTTAVLDALSPLDRPQTPRTTSTARVQTATTTAGPGEFTHPETLPVSKLEPIPTPEAAKALGYQLYRHPQTKIVHIQTTPKSKHNWNAFQRCAKRITEVLNGGGPTKATEVKSQLEREGYYDRMIIHAAKFAGVIADKEGYQGAMVWRLPHQDKPKPKPRKETIVSGPVGTPTEKTVSLAGNKRAIFDVLKARPKGASITVADLMRKTGMSYFVVEEIVKSLKKQGAIRDYKSNGHTAYYVPTYVTAT